MKLFGTRCCGFLFHCSCSVEVLVLKYTLVMPLEGYFFFFPLQSPIQSTFKIPLEVSFKTNQPFRVQAPLREEAWGGSLVLLDFITVPKPDL